MGNKFSVVAILEGNEEECLFDIVDKCKGISEDIDFVYFNAGGFGNVGPFFQEMFSDPGIDCVIAVYDVDNKAKEKDSPYCSVRKDLVSILGDNESAKIVSFCTNPNILQILLLGCDCIENTSIQTSSKKDNTDVVTKYWPKINAKKKDGQRIKRGYDASKWQLDIIKNSYIYEEEVSYSYDDLLSNTQKMNVEYETCLPASNIGRLLLALKRGDIEFFKKIKEATKGE